MPSERRRKAGLPPRGFAHRYPRTFILLGSTICLSILFSKPIYDIFFSNPPEDLKTVLPLLPPPEEPEKVKPSPESK